MPYKITTTMNIEGKLNEGMIKMKLHLKGIGVTNSDFKKFIHEYNNYEMPISERIRQIASEEDVVFYEWCANKI